MVHDAGPRVRLLGRPAVRDPEGRWLALPPGLRGGVLGYLACSQGWVARDELVALFWPDRPEAMARGNLRPMLAKLVRDPLVVGFERERTRVRWAVRSDVDAFLAARRACRWADAWRLVEGELLEGVAVPRAPEFDSWLDIERSGFQDAVRTVGLHVADAALAAAALEDASEVLSTLRRLDPFDEVVVRRVLIVLARRGARGEALAAYESFVELCRDELGAEPEAATVELAEAVRSGREGSAVVSTQAPRVSGGDRGVPVVPAPLTPLIGRHGLMRDVVARVADPGCRLLSLVGPGGIGKTRVALELARTMAATFANGARVVDLTTATSREDVLAAIAAAVGLRIDELGDAAPQIVRWLASRDLLVVLDNVEHLACAPSLVHELLMGAPALRVVVTSRVALGLAAEWRYDVPGMACRAVDASTRDFDPLAAVGDVGVGVAELSDAAALFVAAGRRAAAVFDPDGRQLDVIEGIVERLEGSPLAIELAAPWLRVMDVVAIDVELARGIDVLETDAPDRSPRHGSVRRVLEESWSLLQPRERAVMRRAAVFRGGFTLDAAREVTEAEMPTMLALVNKSFLRRGADGRFSRHPLVWHVARERALVHGAELDAARARHAHHYLRMLADRRRALSRADGGRLLDEIEVDLENVKVAWRWAVGHDRHDLLQGALGPLLGFRSVRGRDDPIEELIVEALAKAPAEGVLHGLLQAGIGLGKIWVGGGDYGEAGLREGLRLAEGRVDDYYWFYLNLGLGIALSQQGRHEEARPAFEAAAVAAREFGDVNFELSMRSNIAGGVRCVGEALGHFRALEARARGLQGTTPFLCGVLKNIAVCERLLGDFTQSERTLRSARPFFNDAEAVSSVTFAHRNHLAVAYLESGRLARAEALACRTLRRRAFAHAREQFGDVVARAAARLGRVALVRRDFAAAESWSRRALDRHRTVHGSDAGFDFALETMARAALATGDHEAAASWLDGVGRGPHGGLPGDAVRIACRCCEVEVLVARGETAAARELLREVLEWATYAELVAATLGALVSAARLFRAVGEADRAESLLRYVRDHRRATFEARSSAALVLGGGTRGRGEVDADNLSDEPVDDTIAGVAGVAAEVAAALGAARSR